jgi:rhodanese-related sulfurtransferase
MLKLLILMLFSSFCNANIQQITPPALLKLIEEQKAPLILDVRSAEEYQQGHIQGALNIAYDQLQHSSAQLNKYKKHPIVVYCRSGRRAQIAYQVLQQQGFSQIIDLKGHINLWQQYQYPLQHSPKK